MSIVHPATVIICGGSGSGKTILTRKLIIHHRRVIRDLPAVPKVIYCYGIEQPVFNQRIEGAQIVYRKGMVTEQILKTSKPDIVVIDDLMQDDSEIVKSLFIKLSHHLNITVIFITQNLFDKSHVILRRNAHYIIMMRNPGDKSQVAVLGRQLFPRRKRLLEFFHESYDDATSEKFGYLLIDVSPQSIETQKLKTNIFPGRNNELRVVVYQPKNE